LRRKAYRQKATTCPQTVRSRQRACHCPTGPADHLEFAGLCQQPYQRRYAGAFDTQPNLADDLGQQHRYNAPCAAAPASCGQGQDAAKRDGNEKARLRTPALTWLQADLTLWSKLLGDSNPQARAAAGQAPRHWQEDTDLAAVRDSASLASLPAEERNAWCKVWAEVHGHEWSARAEDDAPVKADLSGGARSIR
jgi:hypothetical protein